MATPAANGALGSGAPFGRLRDMVRSSRCRRGPERVPPPNRARVVAAQKVWGDKDTTPRQTF
eukprot:scaffold4365_cov70-Phaeocystis_antarctica.AAC.6